MDLLLAYPRIFIIADVGYATIDIGGMFENPVQLGVPVSHSVLVKNRTEPGDSIWFFASFCHSKLLELDHAGPV